MKSEPIFEVAPISGSRVKSFSGKCQYIATGSLSDKGVIFESVTYKSKPSRADIIVSDGDVLFARMKETVKVLSIGKRLNGVIVSTGFSVHKPIPKKLYKLYFEQYLKTSSFNRQKNKYCTGAIQPAITNTGLKKMKIPIPENYDDQVRIACILSRAEGLIEKRKESIRLLDEFLKSTFLEMFGDPVRNEKGWDVVNLEDLCRKIVDCPHSTPVYSNLSTKYYCIRSSDIQDFRVNLSETKEVPKNVYDDRIRRHIPEAGEVVYTREGGRLGYAAILPENSNICLGQRMMLFIADISQSTNIFIWSLLNSDSIRKKVLKMAGGGAAPRVNIKDLKQIKVIKPFLKKQLEYSEKIVKIESLRMKYQVSLDELERFYGSLSQRVFKGELDLSRVNPE